LNLRRKKIPGIFSKSGIEFTREKMAKASPVRLVVIVVEGNFFSIFKLWSCFSKKIFSLTGSNFHQLDKNTSLLLRGRLEGTTIDSDPIPLSTMKGLRLEIGEELVWKMSLRNFQRCGGLNHKISPFSKVFLHRIKSSKALKLDCFNFKQGCTQGNSVGYIIVNLKSVTDSTQVKK